MTNKHQLEILQDLEYVHPDFEFSQEIFEMTELSGHRVREQLLLHKSTNPKINLKNLLLHFHHKLSKDRNSHNAICKILLHHSLETAERLDKEVTAENAQKYPLYGYVLSIKDTILMKNTKSTCGLVSNDQLVTVETPFTDYLFSLGAVFITKGNIPMMLFAMESSNAMFGCCKNPFDKSRTSGGSSGGEAVLVRLRTCNSGIGSDIAGSLRIPANFCGVYSFMITPGRFSKSVNTVPFIQTDFFHKIGDPAYLVRVGTGPLSAEMVDIERMTRVMIGFHEIDKSVPPLPWRQEIDPIRRVGVIKESPQLPMTRTNRRAMREALEILQKAGIQTIEIDVSSFEEELATVTFAIYMKNEILRNIISRKVDIGEELIPAFDGFKMIQRMPKFILKLITMFNRDKKVNLMIDATLLADRVNREHLGRRLAELKDKFCDMMKREGVDVVLCHGMMPALKHDTSAPVNGWAFVTSVWNVFGFCAGAVPVTTVREDEQTYETRDDFRFDRTMKHNMIDSKGLPVGVQVVAPGFKDEEAIQVMKILAKGLNTYE